jgi:hypothetical protein
MLMPHVDLSIQDEFDGIDRIGELRALVGVKKPWMDELISVSADGNTCVIIKDGVKVKEPSWLTWNRLCF